jgi:hypothetical protein
MLQYNIYMQGPSETNEGFYLQICIKKHEPKLV